MNKFARRSAGTVVVFIITTTTVAWIGHRLVIEVVKAVPDLDITRATSISATRSGCGRQGTSTCLSSRLRQSHPLFGRATRPRQWQPKPVHRFGKMRGGDGGLPEMTRPSVLTNIMDSTADSPSQEPPPPTSRPPNDATIVTDPWAVVGGGAVNERIRSTRAVVIVDRGSGTCAGSPPGPPVVDTESDDDGPGFAPVTHRAHLWHALEGMYRYPHYLARWSEEHVHVLEQALQQQLDQVQQMKQTVREQRRAIHDLVKEVLRHEPQWNELVQVPTEWEEIQRRVLHPRASEAVVRSTQFGHSTVTTKGETGTANSSLFPSVAALLDGNVTINLDTSCLMELLEEECFDVFSFPLLQPAFCQKLRGYIRALTGLANRTPSHHGTSPLGRRPVDLDTVGLGWLNNLLFHLFLRPISRHLFHSTETLGDLDWRHGYVAAYAAEPDDTKPRTHLDTHTDDAEVTLNIGLGDHFEGGQLEFRGLRHVREENGHVDPILGSYEPQEGKAVIHAGRHLHDVTRVTSGDRFAYVIWARSWQGVRSKVCPCCWLNRRLDTTCVCGTRWN